MLNRFYQKQQLIMTMLGYYDGVCDGVWGPKCVAAKRQWEFEDNFEPAVPSNGLPFVGRGKLPRGMNYTHKGLDILWDKWDQAQAETILAGEKGQMLTAQHVHDHVMQAEQKQKEDVSVDADIQARGPQQSQPQVSTMKPFAEPEVEEVEDAPEADPDAIGAENLEQNKASDGQSATDSQAVKRDWRHDKKRN